MTTKTEMQSTTNIEPLNKDISKRVINTKQDNIFTHNLDELLKCGFYYRNLTSTKAVELLINERPGTFLIRDSSFQLSYFTMSFLNKNEVVQHIRINYSMGAFSFLVNAKDEGVISSVGLMKSSSTILDLLKVLVTK